MGVRRVWYYFHNIVFKIKHNLYIVSGSVRPPPARKILGVPVMPRLRRVSGFVTPFPHMSSLLNTDKCLICFTVRIKCIKKINKYTLVLWVQFLLYSEHRHALATLVAIFIQICMYILSQDHKSTTYIWYVHHYAESYSRQKFLISNILESSLFYNLTEF